MEDQLKQYLKEFVETLKQGGEFAQEQLPLFVKEYLTWGFWESIVLAIIFVVTAVLFVLCAKYIHTKLKENEPYDEFEYYIGIALFGLGSAGSIAISINHTLTAIKITVAPRVYLIENLMNLL